MKSLNLSQIGVATVLLALMGSLTACNPGRDIPFDFQLHGTWKRVDASSSDTPGSAPLALDYLEVTDKGEVRGFAKDEATAGIRALGRVTGNRLRLTDKAVEFTAKRSHRKMKALTASATLVSVEETAKILTTATVQMQISAVGEKGAEVPGMVLTVKTKTDVSKSGAENAAAETAVESKVEYVKISRGEFEKEIQNVAQETRSGALGPSKPENSEELPDSQDSLPH